MAKTKKTHKEITFKPNIAEHDLSTKIRNIDKWLKKGLDVKCFILFPGRTIIHPEIGDGIFDEVLKRIENGKLVNRGKLKGKTMMMFLSGA